MSSNALKEQRKRDLTAIAIAILLHLVVIGTILLSNFFLYKDVEEYRGPVLVKLGRADAPDEETDSLPMAPVSTEEEQNSIVENTSESSEEVQKGNPEETVKVDDSQNESPVERLVSEEDTGDRGESDSSSQESSQESNTTNDESSTQAAEELVNVTKGEEEGNAYETTYDASSDLVGRAYRFEYIYLYMPLPQYFDKINFDEIKSDNELEERLGKRTSEDKKEFLLRYYQIQGDEYYLFNPPSIDERPQLWLILEDGGYDLKNAEYKRGQKLKNVVLEFIVNVGEGNTISDIIRKSSSGNGDVDNAVIYGFQKASYYNSSDIPVKGRFTYRFE